MTIRAPTRVEIEGDGAYVIVPAVYSFKEKGVPMRATAQMTFALKKGAGGWLIHALDLDRAARAEGRRQVEGGGPLQHDERDG